MTAARRSSTVAVVTASAALLAAGVVGWSLRPVPQPVRDGRVACAPAAGASLYDCHTGVPMVWYDGAWFRR